MSVEDLKAFGKKCAEDKALQDKAKAIGIDNINGLIKLGKDNGFTFTGEDMLALSKEVEKTHKDALDEKELEAIAGGVITVTTMAAVGAAAGVIALGIQVGQAAAGKWK